MRFKLEAVEVEPPLEENGEPQPINYLLLLISLGIGLSLVFLLKYPPKSMLSIIEAILPQRKSRVHTSDANWQHIFYDIGEPSESIQVGEWLDEHIDDQRKLSFKPTRPLKEPESDLIEWLEMHLSNYGTVTLSENGEIEIICSEGVQHDKLLEQISWVYYTLQENIRS